MEEGGERREGEKEREREGGGGGGKKGKTWVWRSRRGSKVDFSSDFFTSWRGRVSEKGGRNR